MSLFDVSWIVSVVWFGFEQQQHSKGRCVQLPGVCVRSVNQGAVNS